jgi:hypothetical protein
MKKLIVLTAIATVLFLVTAVQARERGWGYYSNHNPHWGRGDRYNRGNHRHGGWEHRRHHNGWNNRQGCNNRQGYYYPQYSWDRGVNAAPYYNNTVPYYNNTVPYYNNMVPYNNNPYNDTMLYNNGLNSVMGLIAPFLQGSPGY